MFTATVNRPQVINAPQNPEPQLAIVLYSQQHGGYASLHNVKDNKLQMGKLTDLGAVRRILTRKVNEQQNHSAKKRIVDNELMPEKVLISAPDLMVWHTPKQKRPMWFNRLKHGCVDVWWPSLVYAVRPDSHSLTIWAKATDSRPTSNTRLYHAPLMNINVRGQLCQGGAQLPKHKNFSTLSAMEDTLFESFFTHLNFTSRKPLYQVNEHVKFWQEKEATNTRLKATDMLSAMTMGNWLNHMLNGGK